MTLVYMRGNWRVSWPCSVVPLDHRTCAQRMQVRYR